jgi:histone deacetylase 1/2
MDPSVKDVPESMKLGGPENYVLWSYKVKMLLLQEGLWKHVQPTAVASTSSSSSSGNTGSGGTSGGGATIISGGPPSTTNEEEMRYRAVRIIISTLQESILLNVVHLTNPREIWEELRQMCEVESSAGRLALKEQLYSTKLAEGKGVRDYLQELNLVVTQLARMGVSIPDEDLVGNTLNGLPRSWSTFKQIQRAKERLPKFSELKGLLLQEEIARKLESRQEEEVLALREGGRGLDKHRGRGGRSGRSNQGRGRSEIGSRTDLSHIICHKCGKRGHFARNCDMADLEQKIQDLQLRLSKMRQEKSTQVNLTEEDGGEIESNSEEINVCLAAFAAEEDWFLDSGATSHVTGNRSLLLNLDQSSVPSVRLAGNQVMPVEGKGNVRIEDTNGEIKIVSDVLYVPGVRTNLLSVGKFTDLGCSVVFYSNRCYIYKKNNIFLQAVRDQKNRLYRVENKVHQISIAENDNGLSMNHKDVHSSTTRESRLSASTSSSMHSNTSTVTGTTFEANSKSNSLQEADLWHQRCGHLNFQSMYHMTNKDLVVGIPKLPLLRRICRSCALGKMHKERIPQQRTSTTTRPLELIHSDICGPFPIASRNGSKYILTFVDDFTRMTWLYFLKEKSQTFEAFKQFKTSVENKVNQIGTLRSDRGGEYMSTIFLDYCRSHGIHRQLTSAYSPFQNGLAERKNRSLLEAMRSMAAGTKLPKYLWEELAKTACYLQNRAPTKALKLKTPYEMYSGIKPNLRHLRVIGCVAYCLIPSEKRDKLAPTAIITFLVGYDSNSKAYRCYHPATRKIIISRDVRFDEQNFTLTDTELTEELFDSIVPVRLPVSSAGSAHKLVPTSPALDSSQHKVTAQCSSASAASKHEHTMPETESSPVTRPCSHDQACIQGTSSPHQHTPHGATVHLMPSPMADVDLSPCPVNLPAHSINQPLVSRELLPTQVPPETLRRSHRLRKSSIRLQGYDLFFTTEDHNICSIDPASFLLPNLDAQDPCDSNQITFNQAISDPTWITAMEAELESIRQKDTWVLQPLPSGKKAISCAWIFKTKPSIGNNPPIHKARLVAHGNLQKKGIDFTDTFAPVIKWATIRTVVAVAAAKRWSIHHMDVRTAFLNGILQEEVYVKQPKGFVIPGQENLVYKLKKSLYGLRQSSRSWYTRIDSVLRSLGLLRSHNDPNLYYQHANGETLILMLYVDDIFITGTSEAHISKLKHKLHNQFEMTDLGHVKRYLGITFEQSTSGILLHQHDYALSILQQFNMTDCKTASTPLPQGLVLVSDMHSPYIDSNLYCQLVGKLIFLTITRPDIAYAVSRVSSYMSKPQISHLDAAKHILRYIKHTADHGIFYQAGQALTITGYTDADWGSCPETRRSMGAYIFLLAGGPITWQSKRQHTVSRSSTESEYRALSDSAQEAVWLRRLLQELQVLSPNPHSSLSRTQSLSTTSQASCITIFCDNQSALKLAQNPVFHARSKHVEIHYHFIRERVLEGEIEILHINSQDQPADFLTKPLGKIKFTKHRDEIGIQKLDRLYKSKELV